MHNSEYNYGKERLDANAVHDVKVVFLGGLLISLPKLRSMELLDNIESCSYGIYSGSIQFFFYNHTFDLNIVIRTITIHKGHFNRS